MTATSTREALLDAALEQISERGYGGTSIRDLASAAGIKGSSVYKHFPDKQALFNALLARTTSAFDKAARQLGVEIYDAAIAAEGYRSTTPEQLATIAEAMFDFYLHDPSSAAFRKLLTVEQYRTRQAGKMLHQRMVEEPLTFQARLFAAMDDTPPEAAELQALAFWGPIHTLLALAETDEPRARALLRRHVTSFAQHRTGAS